MMTKIIEEAPEMVAESLFDVGAVKVNLTQNFMLSAGINSPLYCDARLFYSNFDARARISALVLFWINKHHPDIDAVVGVMSGGIGLAASLANNKQLPLLYVRRAPKDHGLFNQIEGELPFDGAKVIVVDDVITTGQSALKVVEALRRGQNGKRANVLSVCTVFDWNFPAVNQLFEDANIEKRHLTTLNSLVAYGVKHQLLTDDEEQQIRQFYRQHC